MLSAVARAAKDQPLMKVLCVNSAISPYGGVEFAAMNLALGLVERGHDVHFLAAKGRKAQAEAGGHEPENVTPEPRDGIHRYYREFPRTFPLGEKHGLPRRVLWHMQDLAHPSNEKLFADVLNQVRPEIIILHNITAVGLNVWRPIQSSGIPCIQVIHDLSLICFQIARFRFGRQCAGLCIPCRLQKAFRFSLIAGASNFAFVSPSHATLHEIERYVDLSTWRREVISNPNSFVVKARNFSVFDKPRLLYVGRLDPSKGVEMMLRSAEVAHKAVEFDLDILGTGSLERPLRHKYAKSRWATFHGSVDQETIAAFMSRATALLVPSLWLETVPGVAVHALFAGLPVLGSRIGGIPEHVADNQTGRLLPPGDESAWTAEIVRVVSDREQVVGWSAECTKFARQFAPKLSLDKYEKIMHAMHDETARALET
jgi:glycosyltransferase involved in cell wall biosynthesis